MATEKYSFAKNGSIRMLVAALLLVTVACGKPGDEKKPANSSDAPRAQLDIGYSLLYQEANGIPKLKWIVMFKDKHDDLSEIVNGLLDYYQQLAGSMEKLSKQFPSMRIDVPPMSGVEADLRKAMGVDQAKDFAPVIGKTGIEFERELLLTFYNALDEQRHLVGVMIEREPDPALKSFLIKTTEQLEARHRKVEALLNRRYFAH